MWLNIYSFLFSGAVEQEHSYKSKRRKLKELDSSDSDGSK